MDQQISKHLEAAYRHLDEALKISINQIRMDEHAKLPISQEWERFLGSFFNAVRVKSKESKVNVLSWISVSKLWR